MTEITLVGIDLAKRNFHVCAMDVAGHVVVERRFGRSGLLKYLAGLAPCHVAMEACGGAHDWGRRIEALGHRASLIHARRVSAFVGAHKNDRNDARAICEAARQPGTRLIAVKNRRQQALQSLTRLRDGLVRERTAEINRLRGILQEFGIVLPQGRLAGLRRLRELMADPGWPEALPAPLDQAIADQVAHMLALDTRISALAASIGELVKTEGAAVLEIPGFGPLNTAMLLAAVSDPSVFPNGRQFAAWIGLVPRQDTTGGRVRLRGITKHGDKHLRRCLIHGARAVVRAALRRETPRSSLEAWIQQHRTKMHKNVLTVAVANKMARIAWAVMTSGSSYQPYPDQSA